MRLFNQKRLSLDWDMNGKRFTCEPFGPVDVPDDLVASCRSRGLPLDVSPVAPTVKAQVTLQAEQDSARGDEVRLLKLSLEAAKAGEAGAKANAEGLLADLAGRDVTIGKLQAEVNATNEKVRIAEADKRAAESLLEETARKLQVAEDWIGSARAEAIAAADKTDESKKKK